MPNVAAVLKEEIMRLARKQARAEVAPLRKSNADLRKSVAGLRRENADLVRRMRKLESMGPVKAKSADTSEDASAKPIRFSPKWVLQDRQRLELSAKDYGALVGVTQLTIYNWEKGKSRPRVKQLGKWARVRQLSKAEAWAELE